ncbi:DUF1036 domain-containing protein [Roseibacterium beibuensis]|uniref:DUF1036 domain-containing protein n=1 Tax=[Roseibacterium] beibuensis TaxID=1193142 RepID=UPI00217E363D|nr:DUF1036 domain-containing protein [Roseibacterium beibuensis]MCS6624921.1 DUF1036 domain-containing protein [Roseibacterium beibuensis]
MKAILTAAVAASLTFVVPTPASAQKANSSYTPTVDLKVCNESGRNATVAVSYVEVGTARFINRGWYDVYNGSCIDLVSTDNSNFYMYADATDGSGRSWSGAHALCVQYPGPYTFWSDGSDTCPSGYETRDFVPMHAEEVGDYTWTLEP